jgi:nucleoside-diphosphate-sugar epimerase
MVKAVFDYTGFHPKKLVYQKKPSGPLNRVADNALAFKMLGWKPKYSFSQGLQKTIDWYYKTKSVKQIEPNLNKLLIEK